jgi:hypothetical protein
MLGTWAIPLGGMCVQPTTATMAMTPPHQISAWRKRSCQASKGDERIPKHIQQMYKIKMAHICKVLALWS